MLKLTCRTCKGRKVVPIPGLLDDMGGFQTCPECKGDGFVVLITPSEVEPQRKGKTMSSGDPVNRDWNWWLGAIVAIIMAAATAWNSYQAQRAANQSEKNEAKIEEVKKETGEIKKETE